MEQQRSYGIAPRASAIVTLHQWPFEGASGQSGSSARETVTACAACTAHRTSMMMSYRRSRSSSGRSAAAERPPDHHITQHRQMAGVTC